MSDMSRTMWEEAQLFYPDNEDEGMAYVRGHRAGRLAQEMKRGHDSECDRLCWPNDTSITSCDCGHDQRRKELE